MSRHNARDMLAFLVNHPKKQPYTAQPQVATTREIPMCRRPESIDNMPLKYYQRRARPNEAVETTIAADISAQLNKYSETPSKKINNSPNQRLSHKLFLRNGASLQYSVAHNS